MPGCEDIAGIKTDIFRPTSPGWNGVLIKRAMLGGVVPPELLFWAPRRSGGLACN